MPFDEEMKKSIMNYCLRDVPNDSWYKNSFDFIKDQKLKMRLISEFKNARFIYKIFEGLSAEDELMLAEIKMQVLIYASIYEATLHYILFDEYYKDHQLVKDLYTQKVNKPFSIPTNQLATLTSVLSHDKKKIIPYYETTQKRDISKIRFDEKCKLAFQLGILKEIPKHADTTADVLPNIKHIDGMPIFCSELIRIYEVRNAIHIHAELKKDIEYHLTLSRIAYRRMKPFLEQIKDNLTKEKMLNT